MANEEAPVNKEAVIGLPQLVALKKIPFKHSEPLRLYVGDGNPRSISEWMELHKELMSKPTGMSRAKWHPIYAAKVKR